jgi:hypothetical protein
VEAGGDITRRVLARHQSASGESGLSNLRDLAVKVYREELKSYIEALSAMEKSTVKGVLVLAVWQRATLQLEGLINPLARVDSIEREPDLDPELKAYPLMLLDVEECMKFFDENGHTSRSFVIKVWLHTLRAIIRPEIAEDARKLWGVLEASVISWDDELEYLCSEDISLGVEESIAQNTLSLAKSIVALLPPMQLMEA